jgi:hypothetical protein
MILCDEASLDQLDEMVRRTLLMGLKHDYLLLMSVVMAQSLIST